MTDPATKSATAKAFAYAMNDLGANRVYDECKQLLSDLGDAQTSLIGNRGAKRIIEQAQLDREMDVSAEERGKHSDMSDAAMGRHLKIVFTRDQFLIELRSKLTESDIAIWQDENDIRLTEAELKVATSRMNELGGLFQYLAIIKAQAMLAAEGGGADKAPS